MRNKKLQNRMAGISLVFAVLALTGVALSCSTSSPSSSGAQIGNQAPDFTMATLKESEITLSQLYGKPVLLDFWTTRCGYCVKQLPYFDAVAKQSDSKIAVVTINMGESASRLKQFFGSYQINFIVALDKDGKVSTQYEVMYTPTTFFIDSQGIIRDKKVGAFSSEMELLSSLRDII